MNAAHIQSVAKQYHVHPSRELGQNFLLDDVVCEKIVAAAEIKPGDTVLEVGPGFGALTQVLIATGAQVIAVEKDRHLAQYLQDTYGTAKNFTLHTQDALRFDIAKHVPQPYIWIGNLPYSITSPLIEHILEHGPQPTRAVLMVQKEVAQRMSARVPDMNLLALTLKLIGEVHSVLTVAPHAFWPQPEVDSAVVRIDVSPHDISEVRRIQHLARIGFAHKRKQLLSSLVKAGIATREQLASAFTHGGLSQDVRPQAVDIGEWRSLVLYLSQF